MKGKKRIQKKLLIFAMCLTMVAGNALTVPLSVSAEEQEQEGNMLESNKEDTSKKEEVTDDNSKKEEVTDDNSKKEEVTDDASKKEDVTDDASKKEEVTDDASKKEDVTDDNSKKEEVTDDASKKEEVTDDASKKEEVTDDTSEGEDTATNTVEQEDISLEEEPPVEEVQMASFARLSRASSKTQEIVVGQTASLQSLKTLVASCPWCDGDLTEDAADNFRNVSADVANSNVLRYTEWTVGRKAYSGLQVPCMEMHFQGLRPGTTGVTMNYQSNFERSYSSGYCDFCGNPVSVPSDYSWYSISDTFNVVVLANYTIAYSANGDNVTNMPSATTTRVAEETATLNVTSQTPKREGYEFLGWAESATAKTAQYGGGEQITLNWVSGSTTTKTLYAVWSDKKETSYKVVREYFRNGQQVATVSSANAISGKIGDSIDGATIASANPNWNYYTVDDERIEFAYKGYTPNPFVLTEDTNQVITLRYEVGCGHNEIDYTDNGDGTHDGKCDECGKVVVDNEKHEYKDGECTKCGATCDHDDLTYTDNGDGTHDGKCDECGKVVVNDQKHTYKDGECTKCGATCDHDDLTYTDNGDGTHDGKCDECGKVVVDDEKHEYKDGECTKCGATCDHDDLTYTDNGDGTHDGKCDECGKVVVDNEKHEYKDGECTKCGTKCDHDKLTYTDNKNGTHDGKCDECGKVVVDDEKHDYKDGVCTKCGSKKDSGTSGENKPSKPDKNDGKGDKHHHDSDKSKHKSDKGFDYNQYYRDVLKYMLTPKNPITPVYVPVAVPSTTQNNAVNSNIPKTGDESHNEVLYVVLFGCASILTAMAAKRIKDAKKEL